MRSIKLRRLPLAPRPRNLAAAAFLPASAQARPRLDLALALRRGNGESARWSDFLTQPRRQSAGFMGLSHAAASATMGGQQ